ncbi:MAG: adenosylcobinamide-GDP ribazoletransferase [Clostridiales bacterium]|nr:adenosylcobinamide-GDP ribazoletransferase [Clostridiales bacterium]
MKYLKRFIVLMGFMTTIPVGNKLTATDEDFGKGLAAAPLVGLVIGFFLALSGWLLGMVFPSYVAAVMIFVVYVLLTGGLHLDGLGDTFDGVFSGRPRERILEIMRDSRIGTNALLAVVSVILLDVSLITAINGQSSQQSPDSLYYLIILLLFPVAGRIGSLTAAAVSKYARQDGGLGKSFIDYCSIKELAVGLLLYFAIFFGIMGYTGLLLAFIPPISAFLSVKFLCRKTGGATGDILGAVCELTQVVFLIEALLFLNL